MARKVRDKELDTREARSKLKPRGKPYWRTIERGLHLGYRRLRGKAGTWWARHYVGDREYEIEGLGNADDYSDADGLRILDFWQAQTKAREAMVKRARAEAGIHGPLTVRAALEIYLVWLESERKSAYEASRRVKAFIYPDRIADIECDRLTADEIREWRRKLASQPPRVRTGAGQKQKFRKFVDNDENRRRRRSSANRTLTVLKAALNHAFKAGKIHSDTAWRLVKPFENVDAARVRYLTVAEAQRLINACDPKFRPLVQGALQTGARYSELTRLECHDFNRDAGTLAIRQSKTGKPRHVVLTDEGVALFRSLTVGRPGGDLIFQNTTRSDRDKTREGTEWRASEQARPMKTASKHAAISPPVSFHVLRHTWASLAVMNGVPLLVVAKNLGHSDTRMVERHYGHLAPSYIADAIRSGAPRFGFEADKTVTEFPG